MNYSSIHEYGTLPRVASRRGVWTDFYGSYQRITDTVPHGQRCPGRGRLAGHHSRRGSGLLLYISINYQIRQLSALAWCQPDRRSRPRDCRRRRSERSCCSCCSEWRDAASAPWSRTKVAAFVLWLQELVREPPPHQGAGAVMTSPIDGDMRLGVI